MKFVITGGPGFGKTTIINALRTRGYWGGKELFDEFILDQLKSGGQIVPWLKRDEFESAVLPLKVVEYQQAPAKGIDFFDRGFCDHVAYCLQDGVKPHREWIAAINTYRYDGIFLVPPWKQIWKQDNVRREEWEKAVSIHNHIKEAYRKYGYDPV